MFESLENLFFEYTLPIFIFLGVGFAFIIGCCLYSIERDIHGK